MHETNHVLILIVDAAAKAIRLMKDSHVQDNSKKLQKLYIWYYIYIYFTWGFVPLQVPAEFVLNSGALQNNPSQLAAADQSSSWQVPE
jgi:hypothetical protein